MKTFVEIFVRSREIKSNAIDVLGRTFPFGKKGAGFSVVLALPDPRLSDILEKFTELGISKANYSRKERAQNEFVLKYRRIYEPQDFDAVSYFKLKHENLIAEDQERDDEGLLVLPKSKLEPTLKIGCVLDQATVVSESIRQEMIKAGLIGLQFRTIVAGKELSSEFWELMSPVTLPPMPRERLICREVSPGDYQNAAGILDGDFLEKEIHYSTADIAKVEPFDFGLSYEIFGGERWPIVSQKFRQFCLAQKLNVSWSPVRLDA